MRFSGRVSRNDETRVTLVCSGDGNILRNGDAHEVNDQEKSVHDAKELECDTIEVQQDDGQTQREEQARNQRHEG
jgi:hypothetical protein